MVATALQGKIVLVTSCVLYAYYTAWLLITVGVGQLQG
jgi:hypothetical protein